MPLPLVIGLGIGIVSALTGLVRTCTGIGKINTAQQRYTSRRGQHDGVKERYDARQRVADEQERLEATVTLGRAAEFLTKARVKTAPSSTDSISPTRNSRNGRARR
jgi:hypothetical protein